MPPLAASVPRGGAAAPDEHRPSAPALLAAGLLLGVVGGWIAGLVGVRTPVSRTT